MSVRRLSARERRALLHSARELMRIVVGEIRQPHGLDRVHGTLAPLHCRYALEFEANHDVVEDRVPGEQSILLEHVGDLPGCRPVHGMPVDSNLAVGRRHQAADDVEQRALAATARADQAQELALAHAKRDCIEGFDRAPIGPRIGV
jgi:hypothetical protein